MPEQAALSRHEARKRALEVLYESDIRRRDPAVVLLSALEDPHAEPIDGFAKELVEGVAANRSAIDEVIGEHARGWTVARMPVVDRNVLRLGVFELLYAQEPPPPAVAIDEAVELAKDMSTDDSPRYVNGVLSAVLRGRDETAG